MSSLLGSGAALAWCGLALELKRYRPFLRSRAGWPRMPESSSAIRGMAERVREVVLGEP